MPLILSTLVSKLAVHFKRLCHLVLKDADVMLKSQNDVLLKFLLYGDQVNLHKLKLVQNKRRSGFRTPQLSKINSTNNVRPTLDTRNGKHFSKTKLTIKFLETGCKSQSVFCKFIYYNLLKLLKHY